jgi:hypothetical protein
MKLDTQVPRSGRTFHLKICGNHQPNKLLLFGAVLFGLVFCWLLSLGRLPLPRGLSAQTAAELHLSLTRALTLIRVAFGIFFAAFVAGFALSRRAYELIIEGDTQGGIQLEGSTVQGHTRLLRPEAGPYRLAILRKVRDDLPASALDQTDLHLYAASQEDARADPALQRFLRTQILILDKEAEPETLLEVPELLPENVEEVMSSLKTTCNGTLETVRGGGYLLHIPARGKQS